MAIDTSTHQAILFQILKNIYTDTAIAPYLGFKGGTAAMMFHGLDRFSVDLDFDLIEEQHEALVFEKVIQIIKQYGVLKEAHKKRFSLFCMISYEDKARNIKVEINRRKFGSRYEIKTYLGVSMQVMVIEDMFAHKLMAMAERIKVTSRDIYDVWFFLQKRYPINRSIVEQRSGLPFTEAIQKCITQLEQIRDRRILDGLGELLTRQQKDWAKVKPREDTIALLKLRIGEA